MDLASPPVGELYVNHEELIAAANTWAGAHGYALNVKRSKVNKRGIKDKIWLKCDRGGINASPVGQKRLHAGSRLIECPFKAIAKWSLDEAGWLLRIENPAHNHCPTLPGSHPALRKLALTNQIKANIAHQSRSRITPKQILTTLRLDSDPENPMFKPADIYNAKAALRRDTLSSLTPIQALLQNLHREAWHCEYLKDQMDRVTHLFFMKNTSVELLKINSEVPIMDCTYKTNRFKLPLLVISGVTALNTSFYIAFAFMLHETTTDYTWVLEQLKAVYRRLNLPDPEVNITDRDSGLILASHQVFPATRHILCIWHIDKNVLANCKGQFATEENWNDFQQVELTVLVLQSFADIELRPGIELHMPPPKLSTKQPGIHCKKRTKAIRRRFNIYMRPGLVRTSENSSNAIRTKFYTSITTLPHVAKAVMRY
jgi:hypothetical protein